MTSKGDDVWTDFWRSAPSDGCVSGFPSAVRDAIAVRWRSLLAVDAASSLLDIATGRGIVLDHALAAGAPADALVGVDLADIGAAPPGVTIRTGVDAAALPFADASFDRVTSQFGIEYAGWLSALPEAARVTRRSLMLLAHHRDSVVVRHGREQAAQAASLLRTNDFAHALRRGDADAANHQLDTLRAAAENHSMLDQLRDAAAAIMAMQGDDDEALTHLKAQLAGHAARMQALADAAPGAAAFDDAASLLQERGFDVRIDPQNTQDGEAVAVWLTATRNSNINGERL